MYDSMQLADRPALEKTSKPEGASGVSIKERWKGTFAVRQGPAELEVDVSVVDIDDEGLLGVDELQNGKNGPSDLLCQKSNIRRSFRYTCPKRKDISMTTFPVRQIL